MGTITQKLLFTTLLLFCYTICLLISGSEGSSHQHHHHGHHRFEGKLGGLGPSKLFVFGDSYADTGNNPKSLGYSWKTPYGVTFPGKPSGRYSDGRVLTDFVAQFLGLKSPLAYRWRKYTPQNLKYGVNFAFGGTGVFDTAVPYPNMTTQIDFFQQLLKDESTFTLRDLQNSAALVSLSGNDYSYYLAQGGSTDRGLQRFIPRVVNQLALDLQRIYALGVKKILVTALQPSGCLPQSTETNGYQQCNAAYNKAASFHNLLLQKAVAKLNNQTHGHGSPVVILDLYNVFLSVLTRPGSSKFDSSLKPCCVGINQNYYCGSVDAKGNKMYTVCQDPNSSFFWDYAHPTEAGWKAVYTGLQTTLQQLHS